MPPLVVLELRQGLDSLGIPSLQVDLQVQADQVIPRVLAGLEVRLFQACHEMLAQVVLACQAVLGHLALPSWQSPLHTQSLPQAWSELTFEAVACKILPFALFHCHLFVPSLPEGLSFPGLAGLVALEVPGPQDFQEALAILHMSRGWSCPQCSFSLSSHSAMVGPVLLATFELPPEAPGPEPRDEDVVL